MIKIIPCSFLLLLLAGMLNAQSNLGTSYNTAKSIEINPVETNPKSTQDKIHLYLGANAENDPVAATAILSEIQKTADLLERQNVKRKHPRKAIQIIRKEVEAKYLHHYKALSDFSTLFKEKDYNDLTAAALISMLLHELEIDHFLYLVQQQPRIDLLDGTPLGIQYWGKGRPEMSNQEEEQSHLLEVINALQLPPGSDFRQSILASYQSAAEKKSLLPLELTGMLYYRRALSFYVHQQYAASLTALNKAGNYFMDPKLDLVRYAILYQQASHAGKDSLRVDPLFDLYRLHPSSEISKELVLKFAQLAEYYLLEKGDVSQFEKLYAEYQVLFAKEKITLQQLKEIYFIEMAQYSARKSDPNHLIMYLDSLDNYRPNDPQVQQILTPLLIQSISRQEHPDKALNLIDLYRKDFPFLLSNPNFKDVELDYRAERVRKAFDADQERQARQYLQDFEKVLAQSGRTPRSKLWITTAYYSASAYYFRMQDFPNARWHVRRALTLLPDDPFFLHREEVLRNY